MGTVHRGWPHERHVERPPPQRGRGVLGRPATRSVRRLERQGERGAATRPPRPAPGTVLDLGCGEGGDAIWLADGLDGHRGRHLGGRPAARRGTGRRGRGRRGVRTERHDLASFFPMVGTTWSPAEFLHSPVELARHEILRRAADAVAPGGTLVVVSHAEFPPWAQHHDPSIRFGHRRGDRRGAGSGRWALGGAALRDAGAARWRDPTVDVARSSTASSWPAGPEPPTRSARRPARLADPRDPLTRGDLCRP